MNRLVLLVALVPWMLSGCQSGPTASMARIDAFESEEQLRQLYAEHHAPLVVVGHGIYLPPDECLCKKTPEAAPSAPSTTPAESENQPAQQSEPADDKSGNDPDQRVIGGFAEQRVFGGGSIPIKCTARGDCRGFHVLIPLGGEVRYFDGAALLPATDGFVPIRK